MARLVLVLLLATLVFAQEEIWSPTLKNEDYKGPLMKVWCEIHKVAMELFPMEDGGVSMEALMKFCPDGETTMHTWYDQSDAGNHIVAKKALPIVTYKVQAIEESFMLGFPDPEKLLQED